MKVKFSPSINIIRDSNSDVAYIPTPNAKRVAKDILELSQKGFLNFSIIGSYGSGKSSFLWALEKDLLGERDYFQISKSERFSFLKFVGEYTSLNEYLSSQLKTSKDTAEIFRKLASIKGKKVIVIDEFGKFIEYAVRNEPEKEIYFLQQLAEFIADSSNNCLLITTLHQSFDAYSGSLLNESERNEWRKVKGRFKDLTFNEPVEQLLYLAANKIDNEGNNLKEVSSILNLQKEHSIIHGEIEFLQKIGNQLWPLDIFAAYILARGLQRYGQNERSLFTFLEGELSPDSKVQLTIADIYDYLYHEFFSFLKSDKNYDFNGWRSIAVGLERTETIFKGNVQIAQVILKIIGLVSLLGHRGAKLNRVFFENYLATLFPSKKIAETLTDLENKKIILFTKYNNAYRIIEGTDVDFTEELKAADKEIDEIIDVATKLKEYFEFSVINAKAITYRLGTPRFFEYVISEEPLQKEPIGQIDGFINLLFNVKLDLKELKLVSKDHSQTIFAYFKNVNDIKELLIDIERTSKARSRNIEDKEARKEFDNILRSQKLLLNRSVLEALFTNQVSWFHLGKEIRIESSKQLNKKISEVCEIVYHKTPQFKNELVNRHILVGAVGAKKPFFKALVDNYHEKGLGFSKDKFPAEKTIYLTLLSQTGIHKKIGASYGFEKPNHSFADLWTASEDFLNSSKKEKVKLSSFFDFLSTKPFKLTPGFLEFWIPTFLFIKRDDFALFSSVEGYQPDITESHLHAITRSPNEFLIKSFDVEGVKLDLYNKYRELLQLKSQDKINNKSFIESIKPFMVFYHHLNEYAKSTSKISGEAKDLRRAIKNAQDPEKLFFEELPKATGTDINDLLNNRELFDEYIQKIKGAIKDLQTCFDNLLDRVELFIVEEILNKDKVEFPHYKTVIESRYRNLKEHMLIPSQNSFLVRLRSPLDDRTSWINSICHVIMGKGLESLNDKDEEVFKEKVRRAFQELDNMVVISNEIKNSKERAIKIDLSSLEEGTKQHVLLLPNEIDDETLDVMNNVKKALGKNKKMNKFILVNLLKQQLDE